MKGSMNVFEFQDNTEEWSCEWITTARQATTNTVAEAITVDNGPSQIAVLAVWVKDLKETEYFDFTNPDASL